MSASHLYDIWFRYVGKLLPGERITRVCNLTWLIVGLYLSRSVHLSRVAAKLPFRVTLCATVQRLSRFLQNSAFRVRVWYRPIAQALLAEAALHGLIRLVVDGSKVGAGHQLLIVTVAYRHRALPIAWTWVRGSRGHSGADRQLALLRYVHTLLPAEVSVLLVGDCEFGAVPVLQQLRTWRWCYVLRQKGSSLVCVDRSLHCCPFADLVSAKGRCFWYPKAFLTQQHLYATSLLAYWKPGEDEPWLLATNLPDATSTLRAYRYRMWIEEMFGDWKGHGLDLERTQLGHFLRLNRLTFAVALWYLWLVTRGSQTIKAGQRRLVDRRNRRDLSIFRIGLYMTDRYCALCSPFEIRLIPYF